jgi:hypothetical protein
MNGGGIFIYIFVTNKLDFMLFFNTKPKKFFMNVEVLFHFLCLIKEKKNAWKVERR